MENVEFRIEDDQLIKYISMPEFGEHIYKVEVVIDKETFVKCFNEWIKENEND